MYWPPIAVRLRARPSRSPVPKCARARHPPRHRHHRRLQYRCICSGKSWRFRRIAGWTAEAEPHLLVLQRRCRASAAMGLQSPAVTLVGPEHRPVPEVNDDQTHDRHGARHSVRDAVRAAGSGRPGQRDRQPQPAHGADVGLDPAGAVQFRLVGGRAEPPGAVGRLQLRLVDGLLLKQPGPAPRHRCRWRARRRGSRAGSAHRAAGTAASRPAWP
jgi:hypothetical protein